MRYMPKIELRKKIFSIIEVSTDDNILSKIYDYFMMIIIILSLIPLAFKNTNKVFNAIEMFSTVIFITDYILRWITADIKYNDTSVKSFIRYPFSFMAIIDLFSVLPSITMINSGFKVLRVLRLIRTFRVFKLFRYSKNIQIISNVLKKSKSALITVGTLAIGYTVICALIIFNVEPDSFENFFEAIYWATVSLTTMGYGDIYPVTDFGRIITMLSAFVGIAIVALPAGIITAGYMSEIESNKQ